MSTIKERAAALNLAGKLCVRPQVCGASNKPVQSSLIWSGLIFHLRSSVTAKRRRVHLKTHNDCFLGSEAVDVGAEHLRGVKYMEGATVSRDKVVCVCQALLDCHVFEAVATKVFGKDRKRDVFQDSKSALYRFVTCTPSVDELERGVLANGIPKLFGIASSEQNEQTCPPDVHIHMSTPVKLPQTLVKAELLDSAAAGSLSVGPMADSVSPSRATTDTVLPQSIVNEVWREQTLNRLLNLVELPLLEGVLQYNQSPPTPLRSTVPAHRNPDLIFSSNHLDRQVLEAFKDSQEDEWLSAALDCLDFLPDQLVVDLSRELSHCFQQDQDHCEQLPVGQKSQGEGKCHTAHQSCNEQSHLSHSALLQFKLLLYGSLVKHYSHAERPPLLPQQMTDIYTAITDLLVSAKLGTALEALQLCLKLLRPACRDELRRLLSFAALAADPQEIKLDKELENRAAVKRSFSRAIIHNKALSRDKEDLLVVFMLCNIKEIFKIPGALHKGVSDKLASLSQGQQPDVTGATYYQPDPSRPSNAGSTITNNTTKQELWKLLSGIHLDTKISTKERKRLLGQFYQAHPEIFNQYFGESAASVV
ncbi:DEP domain-containing protein 7-like [Nelusetta ayraudi]|uniref:DEP domain-containing protein 7-like n=1 Tax=Nelusetta ayraudi TaxID=303726 RepID=UPI003F70B221